MTAGGNTAGQPRNTARPKCSPALLNRQDDQARDVVEGLQALLSSLGPGWIPLARGEAHGDTAAWHKAIQQLIHHPEQSSSSILRADILQEQHQPEGVAPFRHHLPCRTRIHRRILARRPLLDGNLDQECLCYGEDGDWEGLAVLTPLLTLGMSDEVPFYHPKVRSLAFHWIASAAPQASTITVLALPFEDEADFDAIEAPQARLSRTALALVELQARLTWGAAHSYQKRVQHDILISREAYQALYLELRQRHAATLMEGWCESTDPAKHVFEDIGIATFLILLWRDMFPDRHGKPPCFVDVGCGNGLLVYLLCSEGFTGYGIDVQERKSWTRFRQMAPSIDLRPEAIDAPSICLHADRAHTFSVGSFLIGNHADELTSWLPMLAHTTRHCSGLLNIPCCRYNLDGKVFDRAKFPIDEELVASLVHPTALLTTLSQIERGPMAEANTASRNIAYLRYLSLLHLQCGWQLEKEALRIPSTKNWALIGQRRTWEGQENGEASNVLQMSATAFAQEQAVRSGAQWQARAAPNSRANSH